MLVRLDQCNMSLQLFSQQVIFPEKKIKHKKQPQNTTMLGGLEEREKHQKKEIAELYTHKNLRGKPNSNRIK